MTEIIPGFFFYQKRLLLLLRLLKVAKVANLDRCWVKMFHIVFTVFPDDFPKCYLLKFNVQSLVWPLGNWGNFRTKPYMRPFSISQLTHLLLNHRRKSWALGPRSWFCLFPRMSPHKNAARKFCLMRIPLHTGDIYCPHNAHSCHNLYTKETVKRWNQTAISYIHCACVLSIDGKIKGQTAVQISPFLFLVLLPCLRHSQGSSL